jgi:type II secretory pathway pseudopilin PulG
LQAIGLKSSRVHAAKGARARSAFTIVELLVVIGMIVLILAIAVPGLSAIALQARFNNATQTINGALTRAYYSSLSDVSMTAVRFMPGEWDFNEKADKNQPSGRQHVVTYSYTGTSSAPNLSGSGADSFGEYFARQKNNASIQLPEDMWVAPVEALDTGMRRVSVDANDDGQPDSAPYTYNNFGRDCVLNGRRNQSGASSFELNGAAVSGSAGLLKSDDFMVAFDPQTGARGGLPALMHLKSYDPNQRLETDRGNSGTPFYQRYNFTGIVIYPREAFAAVELGSGDVSGDRQRWLRAHGRPFLVHRFGGGLVMGTQYSQ